MGRERNSLSKTQIKVSQQLRGRNFHKIDKICFEVVCEGNIPYSGHFSSKHVKTAMNHTEALNICDLGV